MTTESVSNSSFNSVTARLRQTRETISQAATDTTTAAAATAANVGKKATATLETISNSIMPSLVTADKFCDYVPVVSTVSNLTDIALKNLAFKDMNATSGPYVTHINGKDTTECLMNSIPGYRIVKDVSSFFYALIKPEEASSTYTTIPLPPYYDEMENTSTIAVENNENSFQDI